MNPGYNRAQKENGRPPTVVSTLFTFAFGVNTTKNREELLYHAWKERAFQ